MIAAVAAAWPLFIGLFLLMAGNALQGAALGVRGAGFEAAVYGFISSGYFAGFLLGSYFTPLLLKRVGHIRVFAALGSFISAAFVMYLLIEDAIFWFLVRVLVGFGYSGVYIVCESWLNSTSSNETRGQTLAAYMFVQYVGVVLGQMMLPIGDPSEPILFILMSVMVSLSFAPILLSVTPAPLYQTAKPMSFREIYTVSPLGSVGSLVIGVVFGVMFGMSSYYGGLIKISLGEIALFLTLLYAGGAIMQIPIGWISDRMDRRLLIVLLSLGSAAACLLAAAVGDMVLVEIGGVRVFAFAVVAFVYGGLANPIYGALLAHTNDFVETDQMAAASGRFIFLNGFGAMLGPHLAGWLMGAVGANGFWLVQAALTALIALYGMYRATQRATVPVDETTPHVAAGRAFTPVAAEMAQEVAIEAAEEAAAAESEEEAVDGDDAAVGAGYDKF